MNIQLGSKGINWTDATWNPVTGCHHGCPYCYARDISNRFGRSFEPAYHPGRLSAPLRRRKPTRIFVGSSADMFGDWVPATWVRNVLSIVRQCPQHTFQFLTKAPQNLVKYNPWPTNCWVGATANNQSMMNYATFCLSLCKASVKFVSAEPLLGPIDADLSAIDWLIIGAQTGKQAHQPEKEWTRRLIDCAESDKVAVLLKDNLQWAPHVNQWPAPARAQHQQASLV